MDTLTVLREARRIIENKSRWTTGSICDPQGRLCAMGAVGRVVWGADADVDALAGENFEGLEALPAIQALSNAVVNDTFSAASVRIYSVNDSGHHDKILALFDRAIAAEEAKIKPQGLVPEIQARELVPQATPRRRDDVGCETREPVAA